MHASPIILVGLGAFAAQALAGGVDTIVDTTVIIITSCPPDVESCPGKTPAPPTTSEVTETSMYCPPEAATTAPAVVVPETPITSAIILTATYAITTVPTPTYAAPTANPSSVTVNVSEVPSATPVIPVAPVTTPASNLSSVAVPQPTTSVIEAPSSAPVGSPSYSNSTLTAPPFSSSETGILTATGSPSTLTSVLIVPHTTTTPESGSASSSSATPKATGAAGRLVVPAVMLGLLAVSAALLG